MATNKKTPAVASKPRTPRGGAASAAMRGAAPAGATNSNDIETLQGQASDTIASAMPANPLKPYEYGRANALEPRPGETIEVDDPALSASTASEANGSDKT